MRTLVWFRGKDLRISDHAPLVEACQAGEAIPLFVLDPYFFEPSRASALPHRMQFLLESLAALRDNIASRGSELILVRGHSVRVIPELARRLAVDRVVAHRWTEPFGRRRDERIASALDVPFELYEGETLAPAGSIRNKSGRPFAVYTPFARAHKAEVHLAAPFPAPATLPPLPDAARALERAELPTLEELGIPRNPEILAGGERAGRARLQEFLKNRLDEYASARDVLAVEGTSRLSVDLKFGTVSARSIYAAAMKQPAGTGRDRFIDELLWREFAHATLWDRPELLDEPFRPEFRGFPWGKDEAHWRAWCDGTTGYPVVDAAARQLLREGYVHNRARMIAASFLTKHLLIHYRHGEAHYLRYLTDGDWAQNNMGWQWSAGCGCDAQPYFRVFNPMTQGEKFDPEGEYVRRYVPELARLGKKYIHAPWEAPAAELARAGVILGETYPLPLVDHATARRRFLEVAQLYLRSTPDEEKETA